MQIYNIFFNRITGPIVVLASLYMIFAIYFLPQITLDNEKAKIKRESTHLIEHIKIFRDYYSNSVVSKVKEHTKLNVDSNHETSDNTIPLPATSVHNLGWLFSQGENAKVNYFSNYPFPNRKDRVLSEIQKESISFLEKNPDEVFVKEDVLDGQKILRVAVADSFLSQTCVTCHNTRADSPKKDWKLGDVRGALEIVVPIQNEFILTATQYNIAIFTVIFIVGGLFLNYVLIYFNKEKEAKHQTAILETKVKQRTKELYSTNQLLFKYKKAIDISTIVSRWDKNGTITYVNYTYCIVSGYDKEELVNQPYDLILHPDYPIDESLRLKSTIKDKKVYKGLIKYRRKNGEKYNVTAVAIPILDDKGDLIEYICISHDITELVNARKKAEFEQKAKSSFLATVSHEIRTPLNAIMGFSNVLRESNLNEQDKENAEIISHSAKSLLSIINDVLDLSKIESGKLDIVNESVIFELFVEYIVRLFNVSAKEKDIEFIYNIDSTIPKMMNFDSMRLQQVISNLLNNAIKFTPKGGQVRLGIELLEMNNKNALVEFSVSDTGIGMSEEQLKVIFETFAQANNEISKQFGGTGLGLTICSEIINLMNSKIEVNSTVNEGTKFTFVLELPVQELPNTVYLSDSNEKFHFLINPSSDDNKKIENSLLQHLSKFGTVEKFDIEKDQESNLLFCYKADNLDSVVSKFRQNNPNSMTIYIKEKGEDEKLLKELYDDILGLPLYGSKIHNFISKKLQLKEIVKETKYKPIPQELDGKVLVAEDNKNNQKLIEILLKKFNLEVEIVSNGEEAIEAFKNSSKYDLILMDINMPLLDGIGATKEIIRLQEEENYFKTPIVALTANSIAGDKEKYLEIGMSDYLSKPIDFDSLTVILMKYLHENISYKLNKTIQNISEFLDIPHELASNLFLQFSNSLENKLNKLKEEIVNLEIASIKDSADDLKSSCITFNLLEEISLIEQIEQKSYTGNREELLVLFNKLEKTLNTYNKKEV